MRNKQFKAESKRLLDLMINSIYTHREIFLRELISNASDAIDKRYFRSLTDHADAVDRADLAIDIAVDKENRVLTVTDNGCGMTAEELETNLGTIAKSGSLAFKNENEAQDVDIIGQFGVGFYAAFMVADCVTVISKTVGEEPAHKWQSRGADGYTIEECDDASVGTSVILHIKANDEENNFDEFLDLYRLRSLVTKYSDYIRYPIRMDVEKSRPKADNDKEYETYTEHETVNSMIPIWKKTKSEVTDEDYQRFYKEKFADYEDAARVIHSSTEGAATYQALLFVPSHAPFNYYTREYEKGLQLYASGVLIMDKCADLLPDHFSFVKGLVDSQDLSLNISREMLQHDHQLKIIASRLEKKIHTELLAMLNNDREKYEKFFKNFGLQLKFGVYNDFGMHKELLQDLLLFYSSKEQKPVTLAEYVGRMPEDQKNIYYACGETVEKIARLPQVEAIADKGWEILYLTDDVDEFAVKMMHTFSEKPFKSVAAEDVSTDEAPETTDEDKKVLETLKNALGDKVTDVRLSQRLKTHPVCLTSAGELSLEMEKVLNAMPNDQKVKANRILEINPRHAVYEALKKADADTLADYAALLYAQALLIEGLPIDDPVAFSEQICKLMAR